MDCKEICHGKLLESKFVYESVIVVQCTIISLLLAKCSVCPHQLGRKKTDERVYLPIFPFECSRHLFYSNNNNKNNAR